MTDETQALSPQAEHPVLRQFVQLVKEIDKENPTSADVQALRAMLQRHPELWRIAGDLAHAAALNLVARLGVSPLIAESLKSGWRVIQDELGYQAAPPLERQLIEQVVLCWLHLHVVDLEYTNAMARPAVLTTSADFWESRLSAAQRRYLRACDALARIRKLARTTPALQVNIATAGGQQVNLAGTGPPTQE